MTVTTLLLDADGVIQHNRGFRPAMAELLGDPALVDEVLDLEVRTLTGHRDLRDELEPFLAAHGLGLALEDLLEIWYGTQPMLEVLALVDAVRARGVPTYLATNQQPYRGAFMIDNLGYDRHFDGAFYSFRMGVAKPDPAFFRQIVESLGVDPARTLFIDDMIDNVEGARAAGLIAEHLERDRGAPGVAELLRRYHLLA